MRKLSLLVIAFIFLLGISGCQEEEKAPTLTIQTTSVEIQVGKTYKITTQIGNTDKTLTLVYSSIDPIVASVDNNIITANKTGTAVITVSLAEYPDIEQTINVTVLKAELTLKGIDKLNKGQSFQFVGTDENGQANLIWTSSDNNVATVDQNGLVIAIGQGTATIKIEANNGDTKSMTLKVEVPTPQSVLINAPTNDVTLLSEFQLTYTVSPVGALQEVTWLSSNETIATVDASGNVKTLRSGNVDIYATTTTGNIEGKITITVVADPIKLFEKFNVANPIAKIVNTFGNSVKQERVYGSVSLYWPGNLNLIQDIMPISTKNGIQSPFVGQYVTEELRTAAEYNYVRSGLLKNKTTDIIYHDTGNNNFGANAIMHASYIKGTPVKARSWHYTVDDKQVVQSLPDDEVGWQGDTYLAYSTTIGIETCVDEGSDLYTTWHRSAKLMAGLLKKHYLNVSNVKQHWDYSGKECPQALRKSGLFSNAIDLVQAEYIVLQELSGYTITYKSNDPTYVNDLGRIIKLDTTPKAVSYTVTITNNSGYNESILLHSLLPANIV